MISDPSIIALKVEDSDTGTEDINELDMNDLKFDSMILTKAKSEHPRI